MTGPSRSHQLFDGFLGMAEDGQADRSAADPSASDAWRRLVSLIDDIPGMVYRCKSDSGWTMVSVSAGVEAVTGRTVEELAEGGAMTYWSLVHPEDQEMAWRQVDEAVAERRPFQLHYRIANAEGQTRWVWDRGRAVYDDDGTPLFIEGIVTDVSESVWSQIALHESEERFRTIIEESQDTVFLADARGVIDYISPAAERMFGYKRTEMQGEHVLRLFAPDCIEEGMGGFSEVLNSGRPLRGLELLMKRKDGSSFIGEIVASRYSVGLFEGVGGTIRDVDERKRAKRELEAAAQAIEVGGMMTIRADSRGRILATNAMAPRLLGYSRDELLDMTIMDLSIGLSEDEWEWRWHQLRDRGFRIVEKDYRKKDGTTLPVEVSATMIELQGEAYGQFIIKDVSRRREAELALREKDEQLLQARKMESIGRLAGGVAHDYNNMLSVIMGHTDLALAQADPGAPFYEDLQMIKKAAQQSVGLTRQLLASASKQLATPEVLDLNAAVSGLLEMVRCHVSGDVTLKWIPGPSVPAVRIDPQQLDQILTNLVLNARDAVEAGGEITIATQVVHRRDLPHGLEVQADASDEVELFSKLTVADDGCGMDSGVLASLFEPFFTTKGLGRGTGLGLSTVYGIVTQNDGLVAVESEVGVGSVFSVYLPSAVGEVAEDADEGVAPEEESSQGRGETVLVVEDEPAILAMATRALSSFGYCVLAAGHPDEALATADGHDGPIDLLLTDVVMPGMNGQVLAERIKQARPDTRCLVMSGYAAEVLTPDGVLTPGLQFIQKPFSVVALADKVREVLDS